MKTFNQNSINWDRVKVMCMDCNSIRTYHYGPYMLCKLCIIDRVRTGEEQDFTNELLEQGAK